MDMLIWALTTSLGAIVSIAVVAGAVVSVALIGAWAFS